MPENTHRENTAHRWRSRRRPVAILLACAALAFVAPDPGRTSPDEKSPAGMKRVGYGPLVPDPKGLLDLPKGFSYRLYSTSNSQAADDPSFQQALDDGSPVPARPDGMAAFAGPGGMTILVRNHEVKPGQWPAIDAGENGYDPKGLGGTTTLWIDDEGKLVRSFVSLSGTFRNCAGGPTPWGSWLTAEECTYMPGERHAVNDDLTPEVSRPHGYMFEVDAHAAGPVAAVPIRAMGRFYHEAAGVDPATGFVYLTEDRVDGLLYRFRPDVVTGGLKPPGELAVGDLAKGGTLEALRIVAKPKALTQNWERGVVGPGEILSIDWVAIPVIEPEMDMERVPRGEGGRYRSRAASTSVRAQGFRAGAAQFAFGEGLTAHDGVIDFATSKGGPKRAGQIWRLDPHAQTLTLLVESDEPGMLDGPDNIAPGPAGDLFMCEDGPKDDFVVGLTRDGRLYHFARNAHNDSELAGVCFSPDGQTMFVNVQEPGITFAIRGPWKTR